MSSSFQILLRVDRSTDIRDTMMKLIRRQLFGSKLPPSLSFPLNLNRSSDFQIAETLFRQYIILHAMLFILLV